MGIGIDNKTMKILDLPLKKEWYDLIESGVKKEEYREIKPYWCTRLLDGYKEMTCVEFKRFTHVRFRYGYTKKTMLKRVTEILMGDGKPEWGAPENEKVFIIRFEDE